MTVPYIFKIFFFSFIHFLCTCWSSTLTYVNRYAWVKARSNYIKGGTSTSTNKVSKWEKPYLEYVMCDHMKYQYISFQNLILHCKPFPTPWCFAIYVGSLSLWASSIKTTLASSLGMYKLHKSTNNIYFRNKYKRKF